MVFVKVDYDLTADPSESPMSSISINFRKFRQRLYKRGNGYEIMKEHKFLSSPKKFEYEFSSGLDIDSLLEKIPLGISTPLKRRISDEISSELTIYMSHGHKGYSIEVDLDVIVEKCYSLPDDETDQSLKEEKNDCAICRKELSGGEGCMEIQCSHIFHKDCVMKWLIKRMSCPICRRCVCGKKACTCLQSYILN